MTDDDDLRTEVRELRSEVDALQHRLGRLESILDSDTLPEEQHTQERDPDRTHTREQRSGPAPASLSSQETRGSDHAPADTSSDAGDARAGGSSARPVHRGLSTQGSRVSDPESVRRPEEASKTERSRTARD